MLGKAFGKNIHRLEQRIQNSTETLGFILLIVLAFVCVRFLVQRRDRQVAQLGTEKLHDQEKLDSKPPTPPKLPE
jgi:hypothetical protein